MLAYSGYWERSHYLRVEREHAEREAKRLKDARARHRKLPKWQRLLKDLDVVHERLKVEERRGKHVPKDTPAYLSYKRRMTTLLRQWNRLVKRLNVYNGTSQQVAPVEVPE